MNRGFSKILIFVILALLVGGGFFAWQHFVVSEGVENKYCKKDKDCKSLSGCDAGCWNVHYNPPRYSMGTICPTLLGPEECICYQNECH